MKLSRLLFIVMALFAISACTPRAAYPPPQTTPPPSEPIPVPPGEAPTPGAPPAVPQAQPPSTAAQISGPAVMALMQRSKQSADAGDLDSAAALLERALDVEPRNPFVYQRLASMRLQQGQASQGETLARKSNSLAGDNPYIKAENWHIIAQTRAIRGDTVGASSASSRAGYYQSQQPQ